MRVFLILLLTLFVINPTTKAQYVTIPDPALRGQLMAAYPTCFNASQMMDTTCPAIINQTSLYIYDEPVITNWEGYQYFKNLQVANFSATASSGDGETLPNLPPTLKWLSLFNMPSLGNLPPLPAGLERLEVKDHTTGIISSLPNSIHYIDLSFSYVHSLPSLPSSLDTLKLHLCSLSSLPALPSSLRYLEFGSSPIGTLPALPTSLRYLEFIMSGFTGPMPTLPDSLEILSANNNGITYIPNFPASLRLIYLGGNQLLGPTGLPPLPVGLQGLDITYSGFSTLPDLPPGLGGLLCSDNNLTSLPALPPSLTYLECSGNPLTCLPLMNPGSLVQLDQNTTTCLANHTSPPYTVRFITDIGLGTYVDYSSDSFPVCNATNNVHGCQAFPAMIGHVFNDYNNNGVKDANEPYRANVKVQLSNGVFTMTNSNGYYEISADNIGSYTLAVVPPNYFTAVPLQYNYNFNSYDTIVTRNFPLQVAGAGEALSISMIPFNPAARPGFQYPYAISYTNLGTTTITPNVVLNYDNTRLMYDSSSNAAVINNGSSLTLAETAMPEGVQKNLIVYFRVKSTAVIGDSIHTYVSIHGNTATAYDSSAARIRGSFDPNDKSATPALSTSQVANGDYIYYTIHFQNTGTDTAFNIVISDSLNGYLQPATLQMINTSHPARVTVNGDMVYCEFLNINLPDSNVNQLKSHGFVSFRIKPKPTATVGSVIPNKAKIYFDYNTPVITAVVQTTIYDASPTSRTYTFNGIGNWTLAANWVSGVVPPSTLQSGDHVVINGSCILNIVVTANSGSSIVVATGKSFFVQGNLIILQ
ncbi:MAG: SdrD B-like domain-containing protein [Ferruginibacter sp.]